MLCYKQPEFAIKIGANNVFAAHTFPLAERCLTTK